MTIGRLGPLVTPGEERDHGEDQADIEAQSPHQVLALVVAVAGVQQSVAERQGRAERDDQLTGGDEEASNHDTDGAPQRLTGRLSCRLHFAQRSAAFWLRGHILRAPLLNPLTPANAGMSGSKYHRLGALPRVSQ